MTSTTPTMPSQPLGAGGPVVSRIGLGCANLSGTWNPDDYGPANVQRALIAFQAAVEAGVTLFDVADIYGAGTCERALGECLRASPGVRDRIAIATKCGIQPGHYDLSHDRIHAALGGSLDRLGIDHVDIYQLHRPDPLTHPRDTARALNEIVSSGRARHIGVSNFHVEQIRALQAYLDAPIRCNQLSLSLMRLAPVYEGEEGGGGDGTLDQCMALGITPLAYRPLAGGALAGTPAAHGEGCPASLVGALETQAHKNGAARTQVAIAWLLAHPAGVIPLVGSANPDHIREAVGAVAVSLSREDWYELWVAARGQRLP